MYQGAVARSLAADAGLGGGAARIRIPSPAPAMATLSLEGVFPCTQECASVPDLHFMPCSIRCALHALAMSP